MKVMIIAGRDKLPVEAAKSLKKAGHEVHSIVFEDEVAGNLSPLVDQVHRYRFSLVGAQLNLLKKLEIEKLLFAGKFDKIVLDRKQLKFDMKALLMLAKLKDRRDDTMMLAIVAEVEKLGIEVISQADVLQDLLVSEGIYTKAKPTAAQMEDVRFGYRMAKGIAGLDIGQTVIINKKNVVAVEAIEGTDKAIIRAGELLPKGGFTVVKVEKPKQDKRFDIPVIGMTTLRNMVAAKGAVIAFEADKTFIIDKEECVAYLNQHNVVFMGYLPEIEDKEG